MRGYIGVVRRSASVNARVSLTLVAGHDPAAPGSNVDAGDGLVVSFELIVQLKGISNPLVQVDGRVSRDSQSLAISRVRVVRDGAVKEVVNFGRHGGLDGGAKRVRSNSGGGIDGRSVNRSLSLLLPFVLGIKR